VRRTCSPGSRLSDSTELNFSSRFFALLYYCGRRKPSLLASFTRALYYAPEEEEEKGRRVSLSLSESTRKDTNRRFSRRRGQRREGGAGGVNAFLVSFSLSLSLRAAVCVVSFVFFFAVCAMRKIFKRPRPLLLSLLSRPSKKQKKVASRLALSLSLSRSVLSLVRASHTHTTQKKNKRGRPKKEKEKETLPLTT